MKCPKCNTFNRKSSKFCRNCGSKFVICPKCVSDNIEDDETGYLQYTCNSCGHSLWGHTTDEECPECGSDDVWDANTGKHPYTCNVCGHNWGNDDENDEDNDKNENNNNGIPSTPSTTTTSSDSDDIGCYIFWIIIVIVGIILSCL